MRAPLLALLLLIGSACTTGGAEVDFDTDLNNRVIELGTELNRTGRSVTLAEVVGGPDWDTVYVYAEWTSAEDIERDVGEPVVDEGYFGKGNLLVFLDDGEVVKALEGVPLYDSGGSRWGRDVRIEPAGKAGLKLVE